jgi:hypothetical protein
MHRQGFDLQLTQYDERGWRATFYTSGDGAQPDERDRHRVGADAVAGDAAGGVAAKFAWSSHSTGALALAGAFAVGCPRPIQYPRQGEVDASAREAREG